MKGSRSATFTTASIRSCILVSNMSRMYIKSLLPDKSLTGDVLDLRSYRGGSSVAGGCQEQTKQPAQCPLSLGGVAPPRPTTPLKRWEVRVRGGQRNFKAS